ncbi:amidase [Enhygromyxa salina]|uniref:Acylamidase n=1 Tax=Enhygromyxa salina TaxID=215803 RepID=A0A2S9Y696_9BACT|nr:amidase [Enhygromyxa salina]PRQ00576.1 Acylamidase [Enhygromyxa salina]
MPVADPLSMSALELAAAIRHRQLSAREAVGAHVDHARAVNPTINAIVVDRYEAALREAELADAHLAGADPDTLPPLFGVPCTIKESFAFTGMPNSSGLLRRRDVIASEDATTVARLKQAGAICIGLTNVSELCMWMESNNRVYGRSNNPYDPRCIVGGSSGGEGAIVGAGASPFGLGADIGGSIRMPAFFCGVFGHKSTGGLVPGTGMHPLSENEALRYLATGPITRRATDLMPLLRILAGPDGRDQGVVELELHDPDSVDLASLEVWLVEDNGKTPVDHELLEALEQAADTLGRLGAKVQRRRMPELGRGFDLWSSAMALAADTPFRELLGEGEAIPVGRELLRWMFRRSQHTLPALVLAAVEDFRPIIPAIEEQRRLVAEGLALRAQLDAQLGERGVLLFPTHPRPAPRHYAPLLRPFDWVYTAIFNVMELPVTQVPMGLSQAGLPLGLQVVGGSGRDHVTIAVACALEREHGGWVRPSQPARAERVA